MQYALTTTWVSRSTLRSVLDALLKKTRAFVWQQNGPAVNVVSLALKNDNPFDQKVAPLDFKGTQGDFVDSHEPKVPVAVCVTRRFRPRI